MLVFLNTVIFVRLITGFPMNLLYVFTSQLGVCVIFQEGSHNHNRKLKLGKKEKTVFDEFEMTLYIKVSVLFSVNKSTEMNQRCEKISRRHIVASCWAQIGKVSIRWRMASYGALAPWAQRTYFNSFADCSTSTIICFDCI